MALSKQNLSIIFERGVETKRDPYTIPATDGLFVLENQHFSGKGTLERRGGYNRLGDSAGALTALAAGGIGASTTAISGTATGLHRYQEELLLDMGGKLYGLIESYGSNGVFQERATLPAAPTVRSERVIYDTRNQLLCTDCVTYNNLTLFASVEYDTAVTEYKLRVSVKDETSGSFVIQNLFVTSSLRAMGVRVVLVDTKAYIFYQPDGSLKYRSVDLNASPNSISAETTVASLPLYYNGPRFDVAVSRSGSTVWLAYLTEDEAFGGGAPGNVRIVELNPATNTQTASTVNCTSGGAVSGTGLFGIHIGVAPGTSTTEYVYVAWGNSTNFIRGVYSVASPLAAISTISAASSVAQSANSVAIGGYASGTSYVFVYENWTTTSRPSTYQQSFIKTYTLTNAGSGSAGSVTVEYTGLASKPFTAGSRQFALGIFRSYVSNTDAQQSTYLLIDLATGKAVARAQTKNAAFVVDVPDATTNINRPFIPQVVENDNDDWVVSALVFGRLQGAGGVTVTERTCAELSFTFGDARASVENDELVITGGLPQAYDGYATVNHGFFAPVFPEGITIADGGAGGLSAGVYQCKFIFEWTDTDGRLYRSEPSKAYSLTLAGSKQIQVTYPAISTPDRTGVRLVMYRTQADGTIFYRSTGWMTVVNRTVDYVTLGAHSASFNDTLSDANIANNEPIYTTSGELAAQPAPPSRFGCKHQNKVFLAGLENPLQIAHSKEGDSRYGTEFSDYFLIDVDAEGGDIMAVASMDEKLIIFKETAIFVLYGESPNDAGLQGTYSTPFKLPSEVGCTNWRSVQVVPDGITFRSDRGIYLLTHDLRTIFIGAGVEEYDTAGIVSTVHYKDLNQVWFFTGEEALVYDYFWKGQSGLGQWSVYTNHDAVGAVLHNGVPVHARADGNVCMHTPTTKRDVVGIEVANINTAFELAWVKLNALHGYQRVKRVAFLGKLQGEADVTVSVAYDYNDDFEPILSVGVGRTAQYAAASGGSPPDVDVAELEDPVQFLHHIAQQKCEAIRFRVAETPVGAGSAGMDWTGITLELGLKAGTNKFPSSNKF